jgi:hypothetical protein
MSASDIKPWIDLISWPLLALVGGLAVLPAIYIFVLRIGSATIGGAEFKLSRGDIEAIEDTAEDLTDEAAPQAAAQQLNAPPPEESSDVRDRLVALETTWRNLQIVTKARAHHVDGQQDLRAIVTNLGRLAQRFPELLTNEDVRRSEELKDRLDQFKDRPEDLTKSALRSFRIRAGKLARKVEAIPLQIVQN